LKNEDNETEILLGNKQLLGIFFVVAVLLGLAFTGGYVVGHGSSKKASVAASTPAETAPSGNAGASGGETHSVGAEPAGDSQPSGAENSGEQSPAQDASAGESETPAKRTTAERQQKGTSATARTRRTEEPASTPDVAPSPAPASTTDLVPHAGQTFLQVAAVGRTEAEAVADVLHKKGFRAHAIPKPGNPKIYRVLIGPVRDTADLSATRDSLRRTGFRDVIVQRY